MASDQVARWKFLVNRLNLDGLSDIVDIGANPLDDPPYKQLLDAQLCRVHGFEPQPDAFAELQKVKSPFETYYQCAVGDGSDLSLNIYRESGLTSIHELDAESIAFLGRSKRAAKLREKVPLTTRRLDDIDGIDNIDLLKIDVQGAETMIFDAGKNKLKNAVVVITELRFFPLYYGEKLQDAQIGRLAEFGLMFHKMLFVKSKMIANSQSERLRPRRLNTQAIDGDAVFVRDMRKPDGVSDRQLAHLALLGDAVFASYDLSLRCIDLLADRGLVQRRLAADYVDFLPAEVKR